ncbi:uncharacterized protein E0L32_011740 [Thyridium curvatum]|uniref:DUF7871 domain-containing protein n=1 Tax=Thyridium curvatum TaxID=1093900 RepID=A0A507B5H2_9PEZI|nr:uncharacterized protein E0L32_011740 [Thyridium curvatum]TPX18365.1 hypothetical protein E0L32_011740 [Thyridium curvatum]
MATMVMKPTTCCGKGEAGCVCGKFAMGLPHRISSPCLSTTDKALFTAQQAKCSCGQQSALHCTCNKASTENTVTGPRCSCRARPAGQCTCDRATSENTKPTGQTCTCGARPADACTCEKSADPKFDPSNEIDFTTKK